MTDHDETLVTSVLSVMGEVGLSTDHKRLREAIENGAGRDKLTVAVEIAVAFMRENAELTRSLNWYKMQLEHDRAKLQEIRDSYKHPYDE